MVNDCAVKFLRLRLIVVCEVVDVRKTHTFTPDKSSGTVKVAFAFDGSDLGGSTVVAFEKLYLVDEKTGDKYQVLESEAELKHPDRRNWVECVIYKSEDTGKIYVREKSDFKRKFKLWEEEK